MAPRKTEFAIARAFPSAGRDAGLCHRPCPLCRRRCPAGPARCRVRIATTDSPRRLVESRAGTQGEKM